MTCVNPVNSHVFQQWNKSTNGNVLLCEKLFNEQNNVLCEICLKMLKGKRIKVKTLSRRKRGLLFVSNKMIKETGSRSHAVFTCYHDIHDNNKPCALILLDHDNHILSTCISLQFAVTYPGLIQVDSANPDEGQ